MKKVNLLLMTAVLFVACSTDDQPVPVSSLPVSLSSEHLSEHLTFEKGEIVPFEGDRDTLRRLPKTRASYEIQEEINQLVDIPFYLQVKGNTSTRQFLNSMGKGSELTVANYSGNVVQQFRLKIPPAIMGIPYLIYSQETGTPISIGYYSSQSNRKILYARANDSGSLFGASWDFLKAQYSSNSYVIQNQDFPEQIGSGWWDIYYPVITVNDANISFSQYNNLPRQEFAIVPVEEFEIEQISYILDASAVLTQMPDMVLMETYTNSGPLNQSFTFRLTGNYKESSTFNRKTSYNVSVSTALEVKVPFIASGEISTSVTGGQEFTYGITDEKTITIDRTYPVNVLPWHHAELSLTLFRYNMDVEYVAVCRGLISGKKLNIRGRWTGVDGVEQANLTLKMTPIDGSTASKIIEITPQMLKSGKPIEVL